MWPDCYRDFAQRHGLCGKEVEIPDSDDLSNVGACISFFDEPDAREEAEGYYPGIVVTRDGFVPIGGCALGSGDPYFINIHDPQPGPVYRIYHDSVHDEGYSRADAIARVLDSYEELLQFLPTA
jgi:hypothetical protein